MMKLVHLYEKWAVILYNNFIGADQLVWMTPDQFAARWKSGRNTGWAVVLLAPPPPPPPLVAPQRLPAAPGLALPRPVQAPAPPVCYEWRPRADDPQRAYLYHGAEQIGGYDYPGGWYRPLDARTRAWGPRSLPPLPPPAPELLPLRPRVADYGVDVRMIGTAGERFSVNGRPVGRDHALSALRGLPPGMCEA